MVAEQGYDIRSEWVGPASTVGAWLEKPMTVVGLVIFYGFFMCSTVHAEPLKVGILAFRDKAEVTAQFEPLATILKRAVPDRDFVVEALNYGELERAVASRQVDFILTNPSQYILIAHRSGLSAPLATLVNSESGQELAAFGGVIFTRSDRADIRGLSDLRGKTIASVNLGSLGGYQLQSVELRKVGLLPSQFDVRMTGMPHDRVVEEVLSARADAGFVRTGVLEAMANEGKLDLQQIYVINRQRLPDFPVFVSTRLYPEWPFASLLHIDEKLARRVVAALFVLNDYPDVMQRMKIRGFTIPADYSSVEQLLRDLRLPPFEQGPEFTLLDVWKRYVWQIVSAIVASALIALLSIRLWLTNADLKAQRLLGQQQAQQLRESEERWKFALEGAGDGVWDWSIETGEAVYSAHWKAMLGYREDEFSDRIEAWLSNVHPDDRERIANSIKAYLEGESPCYVEEFRLRCKNGDWKLIFRAARRSNFPKTANRYV
ncbi:MAG: hypothetical protein Kow0065_03210 [Methylomicrobium sp.]